MKELSDYTDAEKIEWFDERYKDARDQFICIKNTGTTHKDAAHYTWEAVIELLGEGIWIEWNSYSV